MGKPPDQKRLNDNLNAKPYSPTIQMTTNEIKNDTRKALSIFNQGTHYIETFLNWFSNNANQTISTLTSIYSTYQKYTYSTEHAHEQS